MGLHEATSPRIHVWICEHGISKITHIIRRKSQDQPYEHVIPNYGAKKKHSENPYSAAFLDKYGKKFV